MTNVFTNAASRQYGTLGELNARHAGAKVRLAAARVADDPEAQVVASAEIKELDEAIATVLATLALRNADIARGRQAAA